LIDWLLWCVVGQGVAMRVMEMQGWVKGEGIGRVKGVSQPITAEGQGPACKFGIGYDMIVNSVCVCCVCLDVFCGFMLV
jgi:hypothetical protein